MADPLADLELTAQKGDGVNFIPCVSWVRRGVAKPDPEKVKLTQEELEAIIKQTQGNLKDLEEAEQEKDGEESDDDNGEEKGDENDEYEDIEDGEETKGGDDVMTKYDLDNYDDEEDVGDGGLKIGDLVSFANPRDDPYLDKRLDDDDASDIDDFHIKPTDNLILVGHVEGDASILEVYVYNDVENALYVHHDVLLPSFPMALEWMGVERGEDETKRGNLVAVGSMNPIIDVWDIDMVNSLEPEFSLGQKAKKKKKIEGYGHKDAVLALSWNRNAEHVLASGSVDQSVLIWDLHTAKVAKALDGHQEKVQSIQWHPFEATNLLTGCCDSIVRLYDCTSENFKKYSVQGEVEKVLWNHFNPFTFLVGTDGGVVQMFDARQEEKPLWTLHAHSDSINGLTLSSQCPDCLVTGSSDKTMKVWDIADNKPSCVQEKDLKVGMVHCVASCPDAPFVNVYGGDKPSDNLKILDIRESAAVRSRFGARQLSNPLNYESFQFPTANDAEPVDDSEMVDQFENIKVEEISEKPASGASGKYRKKEKKKKKKQNF